MTRTDGKVVSNMTVVRGGHCRHDPEVNTESQGNLNVWSWETGRSGKPQERGHYKPNLRDALS